MVRALIVPISEFEDARRLLGRALHGAGACLFSYNFQEAHPEPVSKIGMLYGAEVCSVGIKAPLVKSLIASYQFDKASLHLKGTVKSNSAVLHEWVTRGLPPPPHPTFEEIAREEAANNERVVFAEDALMHANEVASSVEDSADKFPDFLREAIRALGTLALTQRLTEGSLEQFFARQSPASILATSGKEMISYLDPATGRWSTSKMHLKPSSEMKGFRSPMLKPRLYFASTVVDELKYSIVLYFGPHPPSRQTRRAGPIRIGTKST